MIRNRLTATSRKGGSTDEEGFIALSRGCGLQLSCNALPASAQNYPSRPIRIIVPFEASGAMDVVMRIVGKKVSDTGAAQIVIENKTGAGGVIGVMAVKDAAPDGYLLAEVSSSTHVLNPHTTAGIPYDPVKDFVPITLLVRVPTLLAVPAGSPANSLADLIELAQDQARRPELRLGRRRLRAAHHRGAAAEVERRADDARALSRAGRRDERPARRPPRLRVQQHSLARRHRRRRQGAGCWPPPGAKRIKLYPNIPSMAELGRPEVDVDLWFGIVAPLGTDPAIVRTLNAMFVKAANDPELTERFSQLGVEIATGSPDGVQKDAGSRQRPARAVHQGADGCEAELG